jgi:hypothetical protein
MARLARVQLPRFGAATEAPTLPAALYRARLDAAAERAGRAGIDLLAVYGDREHAANLAYLTGFDPRFEEALLLLDRRGRGRLLVGNECLGYLPAAELGLEAELFQEFSLLGQPRRASRPLREILRAAGVRRGTRVGCVGWKYFEGRLVRVRQAPACDLPAYLVDIFRELTGDPACATNATALFMNPDDGLRARAEPEQILFCEYAATVVSHGVLALLRHLREGSREQALERHLDSAGLPLSCHRMISFGDKARRGLASPGPNRARRGDPFTVAFGVTGALACRAGMIARGPVDVAPALREFYRRFAASYFDVVAAWYRALRVGATGGAVFRAVEARRDPRLFEFAVNPGHLLHLDEWLHSPFAAGSRSRLQSGMLVQMDIIPVSRGPFCYVNAEDGVVLADEALRARLAALCPEAWRRMCHRRDFMRDTLGLALDDSVLPLGNLPGWLPPYALDLETVFTAR